MTIVQDPARRSSPAGTADRIVRGDFVDGRAYTDRTVFDTELRRIFTDGWVFVGHESEVPDHGDYVTRRLGRDPVMMIRGRAGVGFLIRRKVVELVNASRPLPTLAFLL